MYTCLYIYLCKYIYIHIHRYIHICIHTYQIYVYMHAYIHACEGLQLDAHTFAHTLWNWHTHAQRTHCNNTAPEEAAGNGGVSRRVAQEESGHFQSLLQELPGTLEREAIPPPAQMSMTHLHHMSLPNVKQEDSSSRRAIYKWPSCATRQHKRFYHTILLQHNIITIILCVSARMATCQWLFYATCQ